MSDETQWVAVVSLILGSLIGYWLGYLNGQIKSNTAHIKFLQESSARADATYRELSEMFAKKPSGTRTSAN